MAPFDVLISDVPDVKLGALLSTLHAEGFAPTLTLAGSPLPAVEATRRQPSVLPDDWHLVNELPDQSFKWPDGTTDTYYRYRVFAGSTTGGVVHMAIGDATRRQVFGRDRLYSIVFLTSGSPAVPLVEFMEVDDYETSGEVMAVIRGSDGGKKMYAPTAQVPAVYEQNFKIQVFAERIIAKRSWNKLAVIAHKDDPTSILNHALLQARRRGDL